MFELFIGLIVLGLTFAAGAKYGRIEEQKVCALLMGAYDTNRARAAEIFDEFENRFKKYL